MTVDGEVTTISVVYPASFPFRRFSVFAPNLQLSRHQAPDGNLCVFARGDEHWHSDFCAADAVADRVPTLIGLVRAGGEELRVREDPQGEPASVYYDTTVQGGIIAGDHMFGIEPEVGESGDLEIVFRGGARTWMSAGNDQPDEAWTPTPGHALLWRISGSSVGVVEELVLDDGDGFTGQPLMGRWVFVGDAPLVKSAEAMWSRCLEVVPELQLWSQVSATRDQILGVCFREEVSQGSFEIGWVFLHRTVVDARPQLKGPRGGRSGRPGASRIVRSKGPFQFVRALRWTDAALSARIPSLASLRGRTATIVGLGSLGAPVALELAKQRIGQLNVVDRDHLDPGTAVRHPLGLSYAGLHKVVAVAQAARAHGPDTKMLGRVMNIGHAGLTVGDRTESAVLVEMLRSSDVMISATAEHDVNRYLDDVALQLDVPRLYLWSQAGYGGVVALLQQGVTGCYHCLSSFLSPSARETPLVRVPDDVDEQIRVQAPGCGERTFTASHVDLLPISLQAVRLANSLLVGGEAGERAFAGDVFTVQVREPDGTPIPPRWDSHSLPPDPACPNCRAS